MKKLFIVFACLCCLIISTDAHSANPKAKRVSTATGSFDDILSTADDTVQKALDTLDNGAVNVGGDILTGTLNSQTILPVDDDSYDLGSPTKRFNDAWFSGTVTVSNVVLTDVQGNITVVDDSWIGLGAAAGRLEFDDQTPDEANFLDCRVGIGTTAPVSVLEIVGTLTGDDATFSGTLGTETLIVNTSTLTANLPGYAGKVGIGTTTPSAKLEVVEESADDFIEMACFHALHSIAANDKGAFLCFEMLNSLGQRFRYADIRYTIADNEAGSEVGEIAFRAADDGELKVMMKVNGNSIDINPEKLDKDTIISSDTITYALIVDGGTGNVGIGTGSPVDKLEVNGGITLDDNSGASPTLTFRDEENTTLTIVKQNDDNAQIVTAVGFDIVAQNAVGTVNIETGGDTDDFFRLSTTADIPELETVGSADFKINAGGSNDLLLNDSGGIVGIGIDETKDFSEGYDGLTFFSSGKAMVSNQGNDDQTRAAGFTIDIGSAAYVSGTDPGDDNRNLSLIADTDNRGVTLSFRNPERSIFWDIVYQGTGNDRLDFNTWNSGTYTTKMCIEGSTGYVGIGTITPSVELDVSGDVTLTGTFTSGDGGTTNYVQIENDGDVNFVAGAGLQFGEIYHHGSGTDLALAAQDTWYQFVAFDTNGESNGSVTPDHTNDHITAGKAGRYLVSYSASLRSAASNQYEISVFYNNGGTEAINSHTHRHTTVANKLGVVANTCIIDLPASATVELWVQRLDGGAVSKTITTEHITLNVTQIGGTT